MNKGEYIDFLYSNIKDDIEFDSDIIALKTILIANLKLNADEAESKWLYLLNKYNIKELCHDIDFLPLLNDFPMKLIEQEGIEKFFSLINKLSQETKELIYSSLFNIYNKDCGIFTVLKNLIINNDTKQEKNCIDLVIKKSSEYPRGVFDIKDFLQSIITYHLKNNHNDINFLMQIAEIPKNIKDQSLLKTLLIDYI